MIRIFTGMYGSCQARRNNAGELKNATVYVDPDGLWSGEPGFPVYCSYIPHPPVGFTVRYCISSLNLLKLYKALSLIDKSIVLCYMYVLYSLKQSDVYCFCLATRKFDPRNQRLLWSIFQEK